MTPEEFAKTFDWLLDAYERELTKGEVESYYHMLQRFNSQDFASAAKRIPSSEVRRPGMPFPSAETISKYIEEEHGTRLRRMDAKRRWAVRRTHLLRDMEKCAARMDEPLSDENYLTTRAYVATLDAVCDGSEPLIKQADKYFAQLVAVYPHPSDPAIVERMRDLLAQLKNAMEHSKGPVVAGFSRIM